MLIRSDRRDGIAPLWAGVALAVVVAAGLGALLTYVATALLDGVRLPLLFAVPLIPAARWIAARGAPGPATRALTAAAVIAALPSTWSLVLLALTLLDDLPPLNALDDHPTRELPEPVPGPVALVAGLLLTWSAIRVIADLHRRQDTHQRLRAEGPPDNGLVVADWAEPLAVAVPGRPGHLLVTTGILRLLEPTSGGSSSPTSGRIWPITITAWWRSRQRRQG